MTDETKEAGQVKLWQKLLVAVLGTFGVLSVTGCPVHGWGLIVFGCGGSFALVLAAVLGSHWGNIP